MNHHHLSDSQLETLRLLGFWAMPSSPKFFHARQPPSRSKFTFFILLCLVTGFGGFLFGILAFLRPGSGYSCIGGGGPVRSVSVVWDKSGGGGGGDSGDGGGGDGGGKRYKVMGFVGIQTGFGSAGRRRSLRKSWMPADQQGLQRYWFFSGLFYFYFLDFEFRLLVVEITCLG